ncbi:hypothetical protein ABZT00_27305, partial [Streptomyces sp. NPDC005486]
MHDPDYPLARQFLSEIWDSLAGEKTALDRVRFEGPGALPSAFAVTDLAAASFAAAGLALSDLVATAGSDAPGVRVDRR